MLKITREACFNVIHFISNLRYTVLPQHAAIFPLGLSCHSGLNTSSFFMLGGFFTTTTKMENPKMPQLISIPYCTDIHESRPAETLDVFESNAPQSDLFDVSRKSHVTVTQ
jgi:hypothetical protein